MVPLTSRTILHSVPAYTIEEKRYTILIDPEAPNWIATDARGARILSYLDGKRSFQEVVQEYCREFRMEAAKGWMHCNDFLRDALRHGFAFDQPPARPPYQGRKEHVAVDRLTELWIHTNNSCNLSCAHCLVSSSPTEPPGLGTEQLLRVIQEAFCLGVERFYFTGGEPFLRKDIFDLIRTIAGRGAQLVILTNGMLLKGERLRALSGCDSERLRLQISLDGSCPEVNDPIRGKGSFPAIVQGIRNALGAGFPPTVTTTVTASNGEDLPHVTRLLAELGVRQYHLLWLHRRGRALEDRDRLEISTEGVIAAVKAAKKAADEVGVVIDNYDAMIARVDAASGVKVDLSNAGVSSLCVYYDGHVYPSAAFAGIPELECGNLLTSSLEEIWKNSRVTRQFQAATVQKKEICHSCHLKFICGGGDIEHSYFYAQGLRGRGTILGADPYCDLHKHLVYSALREVTEDHYGRLNTRSGYNTPVIYHAMGEGRTNCANGHAPLGEIPVQTQHSNCYLGYDLDRARKMVRDFYGKAAEEPQIELCCPIQYEDQHISHIPKPVLDRFYGCGGPMSMAGVQSGETVVDLGSGGGIDCFIAAKYVGPSGKVIGVDMTDGMLAIANENRAIVAENLGYDAVEFHKGYLEQIPLEDQSADLVTSNCVINLSPDKKQVFGEMWRILKDHGRMVVSDVVSDRAIPAHLKANERLWGECMGGALTEGEFLSLLEQAGFYGLSVLKKVYWKQVEGYHFYSVTVRGYKFEKKTGCYFIGQKAIYHGPFKAVMDEEGHLFPRDEAVEICTDTAAKLSNAPYRGLFTVTDPSRPIQESYNCCADGSGCC